jgi:hypothetical protein
MPMRTVLNVGIGLALVVLGAHPSPGQDAQRLAELTEAGARLKAAQETQQQMLSNLYQLYRTELTITVPQITIPDVPPNNPHHQVFVRLREERDRLCASCHVGPPTAHHELLGLSLVPADETLRDQLKLEKKGLVVTAIAAQSPAERGGIKERDILIESGGKPLTAVDDFANAIKADQEKVRQGMEAASRHAPDANHPANPAPLPDISVRLLREGEAREIKVPAPFTANVFAYVTNPPQNQQAEPSYWIGVTIDPADVTLQRHLKLTTDDGGLVVTDVIKETPAEKAGIKKNDVLLAINNQPLKVVQDMVKIVKEAKDTSIKIRLLRAGAEQAIVLKPIKRSQDVEAAQIRAIVSPQENLNGLFLLQNPSQITYPNVTQPYVLTDQPRLLTDIHGALSVGGQQQIVKLSNEQLAAVVQQLNEVLAQGKKADAVVERFTTQPATPGTGQTEEQGRQKALERIDAQLKLLDGQIKELKASMDSLRGTIKEKDQDKPR